MNRRTKLRTNVYVDGYNLYFSALTKSKWKWLDLNQLATALLVDAHPNIEADIKQIKFFTAPIKAKYASGPESTERQTKYHNALKFAPPQNVEVIQGNHIEVIKKGIDVSSKDLPKEPFSVLVLEEKKTDVNVGIHMYRDAARGQVEQVVLISSDSDYEPALYYLKKDYPKIVIGLVLPIVSELGRGRPSGDLMELADWTKKSIPASYLERCQLPKTVLNRKGKAIKKPIEW